MADRIKNTLAIMSSAHWLAGPLFDKELRVASRRRRSYLLRFAYVGVLTAFLAGVWVTLFEDAPNSRAYQVSRLATVGKSMTAALIWFQFIAAQIAASVLLGDAISSEVRKRTLHMLAVTPLSGLQIAAGKLAGGLLPVVMLLATSLPVLAVVRVLGGVPWDYVVSGVCVTFIALVFAGALHLWVSAARGSMLAVIAPALWYGVLARVGDALIGMLARPLPVVGTVGKPIVVVANPTDVLLARTNAMLLARPATGLSSWWVLNCLVLLAAAFVVLVLTARRIRLLATRLPEDRAGMLQGRVTPLGGIVKRSLAMAAFLMRTTIAKAFGLDNATRLEAPRCDPDESQVEPGHRALGSGTRKSPVATDAEAGQAGGFLRWRVQATGPIRRVEGSPVLWKELRIFAVSQGRHLLGGYGAPIILAGLIVLAVIAIGWLGGGNLSSMIAGGMLACAVGLHIGSAVGLAGIAATMVPKEREARTLPVLLTTPLDDGRIVRDKAIAAFRQGLPALVVLGAMLFISVFCLMALAHRVRLLPVVYGAGVYLVCLLGMLPFLIGLGLYCGVRFQTTAAARGGTFAVVLVGVMGFSFVAIWLVFTLVRSGSQAWLVGAAILVGFALAGAGLGLFFLYAAARRLRRDIF